MIKITRLRELLEYHPETGVLTWKPRKPSDFPRGFGRGGTPESGCKKWNSLYAGKPALNSINSDGYRGGPIEGYRLKAHRVIWAMQTGKWPKSDVDHANGTKCDNSWRNLRQASRAQNGVNRKYRKKYRGVAPAPRCKDKWSARISFENKQYFLGLFPSEIEAAAAYDKAARKLHGKFCHQNLK